MVTLKRCNLIGRSRILERVQLDVREVTRPSFSRAEIEGCGLRDYGRSTSLMTLSLHGLRLVPWLQVLGFMMHGNGMLTELIV